MKNQYLTDIIQQLEKVSEEVQTTFKGLDAEQLNWKVAPKKWSIAQCLDHLITTNQLYWKILEPIAENRYQATFFERMGLFSGFFGRMIMDAVAPEIKKPTKTFTVFEPSSSMLKQGIVADFIQHNQDLIALIKKTDIVSHEQIIITSPVAKYITYSLKDACTIIANHEERHFLQARRVMEAGGF